MNLRFVVFGSGKLLLRQDLLFFPFMAESTVQTRDFEVRGRSSKITVHNKTSLDNNWIGLNLTLVNKVTGAAWPTTRELAFYYGNDGGEGWSEGSREDEVVFLDGQARVTRFQIAGAVVLDPVAQRQVLRPRWRPDRIGLSESDHAPVSSESDSDGDD